MIGICGLEPQKKIYMRNINFDKDELNQKSDMPLIMIICGLT